MTDKNSYNRELLKKYILKQMFFSECEELEDEFLEDENLAKERDSVEFELIGDYLFGRLSSNDDKLFRENYLITQEDYGRIEFVRHFYRKLWILAKEKERQSVSFPLPAKPTLWEKLFSIFQFQNPLISATAFLVIFAVIIGGVFLLFRPADNDQIAENLKSLPTPEVFPTQDTAGLPPSVEDDFRAQSPADVNGKQGNSSRPEDGRKQTFPEILTAKNENSGDKQVDDFSPPARGKNELNDLVHMEATKGNSNLIPMGDNRRNERVTLPKTSVFKELRITKEYWSLHYKFNKKDGNVNGKPFIVKIRNIETNELITRNGIIKNREINVPIPVKLLENGNYRVSFLKIGANNKTNLVTSGRRKIKKSIR